MTEASRLAADLERAIGAGDAATVARLVVDATERERRAASQSVGLREGVFESEALEGIRSLACLGCDTPAEVADMPFHFLQAIDMVEPALIAAVVRARGDAFVADLVRRLVKPREPALVSWQLLRALTRAGVIERPDGDWWAHYVPWGVVPTGAEWDGVQAAYLGLIRDPGILEEELWMLFEVDCGDELQDVTVMIGDRNPGEIAQRGPNLWHYALVRLANEGRVDRGRLLSSAQEATDRWPRRAWYAEFVELLESA